MWPVLKAETLKPSCAVVMKSGNLNFLEPSGPLQACNGTALPLPLPEGDERLPSRSDGFTLRMIRCCASNTRLGKLQSRSGRFGKKKILFPIPEIEARHRETPELSLVITSTMLASSRSLTLRVL